MKHLAIDQEARIEKQYPRLLAQLKQNNPQNAYEAAALISAYFKNNGLPRIQAIEEINTIYCVHMWRRHRTIYKFDESMCETLANQALRIEESERIPCELIQTMPHKCIAVELHPFSLRAKDLRDGKSGIDISFTGECYIYFEEKYYCTNQDTLIAQYEMQDGEMVDFFIPIPESVTIRDAKEALCKYISRTMPELNMTEDDAQANIFPVLLAIQIILYLQAQNADIKSAPPEQKKKKTKRGSGSKKQQKPPKIIYVGYRVGKLLRSSASEIRNTEKSEPGSAKRPHARRGHWHHYWTGPKDKPQERRLILRWVAPTMIHAGKSNDITKIIKIKD